jgi:general stress protein 26
MHARRNRYDFRMASALSQLPPALLAVVDQGASVLVASRDEKQRPSVMRAMASRRDGETITVYLARSQSRQLLADIERSGRVAAMFSQPSTHLSIQMKSSAVSVRPADESDRPAIDRYAVAMEGEVESVGYPRHLARVMLASKLDDLVAVSFEAGEVFDQTPGAKAGAQVAGGAA